MSSAYAEPLDRLERGLDELAAMGPEFRSTGERQEFLLRTARAKARLVAQELRVLAASDDIAEATGDRSTAAWLATRTREAHGTVRRHAALAAATHLSFASRGDGSTDVHARVPDHVANRLRTYLDAYTSPRRTALGDVDQLPVTRRRGEAFVACLENLPDTGLPTHGGTTTSVMVTLDLDTLLTGIGVATTSTGDRVTAEQARRLACQARIIPVVLGREGEVLDLGRSARLFSPAQRKAMAIRDRECTTEGCSIPAAWCEAHHAKQPWARGGRTDLSDGKLLCSFHHHRAHDPGWETHHHPNGSTTFHRRT